MALPPLPIKIVDDDGYAVGHLVVEFQEYLFAHYLGNHELFAPVRDDAVGHYPFALGQDGDEIVLKL